MPGFLIPTTNDAVRLLDDVDESNLLIQFDAYHVRRMEGDPIGRLKALIDRVGHVQIADYPDRHQPGTGQIDFGALFRTLEEVSYRGVVGLEYIPTPDTPGSLEWLVQYASSFPENT
jgi:hydroxypyruvate isomerase